MFKRCHNVVSSTEKLGMLLTSLEKRFPSFKLDIFFFLGSDGFDLLSRMVFARLKDNLPPFPQT